MSNQPPSPFLFAPDIEKVAASKVDGKSWSDACDLISGVAFQVARDPKFLGKQIFLPNFDKLVCRIGTEILGTTPGNSRNHSAEYPVIIATELYADGGHSRIAEDLIRIHGRGLVILSNYFGGTSRPRNQAATGVSEIPCLSLPTDSAENNIRRLNRICNELASHVYILAHHHDVVAYAATCTAISAPVFFIHHSDHRASLGATIESYIHVDGAPHMQQLCSTALKREVELWPQSILDRGRKQFTYPIANRCTATAGAWKKYAWEGPLAYPTLVRSLLSSGVSKHFHIGALPDAQLKLIHDELAAHRIPAAHFQALGQTTSVWQCLLELPVTAYVASAPIHGLRTSIEVQGAGIPLLPYRQNPDSWMDDKSFYNQLAAPWSTIEELCANIQSIHSNHAAAADAARQHFDKHFSPELMKKAIDQATAKFNAAKAPR